MTQKKRHHNNKPLTTSDIPVVDPGKPGRHSYGDGRIWIPVGLHMYSSRRTASGSLEYYFPRFAERREFEALQRAGGRHSDSEIHTAIANCSWCQLCVGQGYYQTELYLRPVAPSGGDRLDWKLVCGHCAVHTFKMPFACCLIAHRDWTGEQHGHIRKQWSRVFLPKQIELEHVLLQPWREWDMKAMRLWRQREGHLRRYPRQFVLEDFVSTFEFGKTRTFTELYEDQQQQEGRVA